MSSRARAPAPARLSGSFIKLQKFLRPFAKVVGFFFFLPPSLSSS